MLNLDNKYIKLIAEGIKPRDNLPDLNDMTDRGNNPLKPFTSAKTVSTMELIRNYKPKSEDCLLGIFIITKINFLMFINFICNDFNSLF